MNKKFLKRMVAFAMAATLVLGNGALAFAAGDASGTGGATGTGSQEGHVDKKVVSVTLPANTTSTYNYKVDPERLVPTASGPLRTSYTGATFTDDAKVYGVYFASSSAASTVYKNESETRKVTNKSSVDIDLTVKAEFVSQAATDIKVIGDTEAAGVNFTTSGGVTAGVLYMQLKMTTGAAAVTKGITNTTAAELTATIGGKEDNFGLFTSGDGYEYREKAQSDLVDWDFAEISLLGKCTYAESSDTLTAPDVQVTWSWADPTATPSVSLTGGTKSSASGVDFDVTFNKGTAKKCDFVGLDSGETLSSVKWGTSLSDMTSTSTNIPLSGVSFTINSNMWGSAAAGDVKYIKLTTSKGTAYVVKVTVA